MTEKQFKNSISIINKISIKHDSHNSLCDALSCSYQQLWKWKKGVVKLPL